LFRPRERAFKQLKCPRPQCVNIQDIFIYFVPVTKNVFSTHDTSNVKNRNVTY